MIIGMTIVLIMIGSSLMMDIYSIFRPFVENLGNISNYNSAYYGAIASVERAQLTLKYHKAGFQGSGGWFETANGIETLFGVDNDKKSTDFGRLALSGNGMLWNISSRVSGIIPESGKGNIDKELESTGATNPSKDYNKISYDISEELVLDTDITNKDNYYTNTITYSTFAGNQILGYFRLPPYIQSKFGNNNLDASTSDIDGDGIGDDVILNRMLNGKYTNTSPSCSDNFTILPSISIDYDNGIVNNTDTIMREGFINGPNKVFTINTTYSNPVNTTLISSYNIIPEKFCDNSTFNPAITDKLGDIISNSKVTNTHLKFSIVNLMKTAIGQVYPFLEYKLEFKDNSNNLIQIPDRFFHISGTGKVGKYKVIVKVEKPVVKSRAESDFTILF